MSRRGVSFRSRKKLSIDDAPHGPPICGATPCISPYNRSTRQGLATRAVFFEARKVASPHLVLVHSQHVEVVPRIDAGAVAIGEYGPHRVRADWLQFLDLDVLLA